MYPLKKKMFDTCIKSYFTTIFVKIFHDMTK